MENGDTASLGTLFQCVSILTVRKCFLMFRWNFLCFSLCPLPLVLPLCNTESLVSPSFLSPSVILTWEDLCDCHFLQAEVPALSASPHQRRCSSCLIIFEALCCTCFTMSTSLSYRDARNWTQHCWCGLTSAEQRGRITSLNSQATLLTQLRRPFPHICSSSDCNWRPPGSLRQPQRHKIFQIKHVKIVTLSLYREPCRSWCLTYSSIFWLIITSCTWIMVQLYPLENYMPVWKFLILQDNWNCLLCINCM